VATSVGVHGGGWCARVPGFMLRGWRRMETLINKKIKINAFFFLGTIALKLCDTLT
jgi:hypothetical protein